MSQKKKSDRKKDILVYLDGVLVNLLDYWLQIYNYETDDKVTPDMVTEWEISKFVKYPDKFSKILNRCFFFLEAPPNKDAVEWFTKLLDENKFRITIVTQAPIDAPTASFDKRQWMKKWFPKFNAHNMIFAHHKYMIKGDMIIDDNPVHLEKADQNIITVVFDQLYNKGIKADYRVSTWKEFYELVNELWTQSVEITQV